MQLRQQKGRGTRRGPLFCLLSEIQRQFDFVLLVLQEGQLFALLRGTDAQLLSGGRYLHGETAADGHILAGQFQTEVISLHPPLAGADQRVGLALLALAQLRRARPVGGVRVSARPVSVGAAQSASPMSAGGSGVLFGK